MFEYHKKVNGGTEEKNYTQVEGGVEIRTGSFGGDIGPVGDMVVYHLSDHLNSVALRLDDTGGIIDREEFYPYGDSSLRTFIKKRYHYTGKEKDAESGLYYYGARYYAAWTCQFLSVDAKAKETVRFSPYAYANNNPLKFNDPTGNQAETGDHSNQPSDQTAMTSGSEIQLDMSQSAFHKDATTSWEGGSHQTSSEISSEPDSISQPKPQQEPTDSVAIGKLQTIKEPPAAAKELSPKPDNNASESVEYGFDFNTMETFENDNTTVGLPPPINLEGAVVGNEGGKTENVIGTEHWKTQKPRNCLAACRAILKSAGISNPATGERIYTARETSNHTVLSITDDAKRGVSAIDESLSKGEPIIVGVNHSLGLGYNEASGNTTDHFIVIVGSGTDSTGKFYRFFEVGTKHEAKGTSSLNKLYLGSDYSLKGSPVYNSSRNYTVSEVRK
jgi:RHS repeat-associated protein